MSNSIKVRCCPDCGMAILGGNESMTCKKCKKTFAEGEIKFSILRVPPFNPQQHQGLTIEPGHSGFMM